MTAKCQDHVRSVSDPDITPLQKRRNALIAWNKQSKVLGEGGFCHKQIETTDSTCLQIALLAIAPGDAQVNSGGSWQLGPSRLACHTAGAADFWGARSWGVGRWSWLLAVDPHQIVHFKCDILVVTIGLNSLSFLGLGHVVLRYM